MGYGASGRDIALEVSQTASQVIVSCEGPAQYTTLPGLPTNISFVAPLQSIDEQHTLHFTDKSTCCVDAIIVCTGYRYQYPFLPSVSTPGNITVSPSFLSC